MATPDSIDFYRSQFRRLPGLTHLNNAGSTPMPQCTVDMVRHWTERRALEGAFSSHDLWNSSNDARSRLANFLGAKKSEVAFFGCTAQAISQMAFGLKLKPGDEILTWMQEYPSSFYPWRDAALKCSAKLVTMESGPHFSTPFETILQNVTPRTRVIATSWVQYQTGAITDLKQLGDFCRSKGILSVVDGIQGLGILPFNFADTGIDAVAGGSHKWLTSPHSTGFLCLREELIPEIEPLMVGAITYGTPENLNDLSAARNSQAVSYEPGSKNFTDIAALARSLQLIQETGVGRIAQEVEWLSRRLVHGLRERGYTVHSPHGTHHRGSIVTFSTGPHSPKKSNAAIAEALQHAKVSFANRSAGIRLSPHAFNIDDDIQKVLSVLS